jgi:hypothetical protein
MTCAFSRLVAISVLFTFTSVATAAGPFDVVKTYRFIPRLSDVVESGGITGRQLDYSAWGKFDLNFGPEVSIPELDIHPSFENVASWRQNRIVFEGTTSQDTPVKMEATFAGRLLKLTGETHPACCDQFAYSMNAIAVTGPFTDFNFDGIVNTADYTVLRNHLGKSAGATMEQGDADGDGDVDAADYKAWKRDLGTVIDPMLFFEPPVISSAAVPEPAMTLLVFSAVLAMSTRIRRRGK